MPGGTTTDPAGLGFRLQDVAASGGVADPNAGMGIASADFDGNGLPDLFVSNSRGQGHAVYRARPPALGDPAFADASSDLAAALGATSTGWGAAWVDLDLDTDLDLVLANGDVPVTSLVDDAEPIQVLENVGTPGTGTRFADLGELAGGEDRLVTNGRGLAAADFDNDGDVDIAINSTGGPLILLENSTPSGNWLEVATDGLTPGARVTAVLPDGTRLVRRVMAGGSYLSSDDPRVLFGLGDATVVRALIIRYPDGTRTRLEDVPANRVIAPSGSVP